MAVPVSTIVKGVKRAMAGEYSRELSVKVFAGQCRLIELGYRQGGPPGYGLRRRLIDQSGDAKGELARGEQKSIQTDRVVLVPGPPEEVDTVRWIYRSFVQDGKIRARDCGRSQRARASRTDLGRPWTRGTVHQVLINEKYIGNNVWNRALLQAQEKARPKQPRHVDPRGRCVRAPLSTDRSSMPPRRSSASARTAFRRERCWMPCGA